MHFSTLLPVVALLATEALAAGAPHGGSADAARRASHHRRAIDRINRNIEDRELPNTQGKRVVKKRGAKSACRPRGQSGSIDQALGSNTSTSSAAAPTTTTSSSAAPAATTTSSAAAVGDNFNAQTTTSSAQAATSSAPAATSSSSGGGSTAGAINGIKAGMSLCSNLGPFAGKLGACYDWSADPSTDVAGITAIPMLWGDGHLGSTQDDAGRLAAFEAISWTPPYVMGFNEPDCSTSGSSGFDVATGAALWQSAIAWRQAQGTKLISPGMCKQADETWLTQFAGEISTMWDYTDVHINKLDAAGVQLDLDHYAKFGKPMIVTEFACVDDSNWTPCTDQQQINDFIYMITDLLEKDDRVIGYFKSEGEGLGNVWPSFNGDGSLTASGQAYLGAISRYH